jgi:hypothetical protein
MELAWRATLEEIERLFHRAMISIYETAKRELRHNATRFLQMISEHGGLATARQLLWGDAPSEGFTTLWSAVAWTSLLKPVSWMLSLCLSLRMKTESERVRAWKLMIGALAVTKASQPSLGDMCRLGLDMLALC